LTVSYKTCELAAEVIVGSCKLDYCWFTPLD
jgi:hypothetical protein